MCGIVAYTGHQTAREILVEGLKRLEYRGYDSSGIAILNSSPYLAKSVGKVAALEQRVFRESPEGVAGIAHTRWATHGRPTETNAHPHTDCTHQIFLVHNGIIENYQVLKKRLIATGHKFTTETDTEVLTHLIESYYQGDLEVGGAEIAAPGAGYLWHRRHARGEFEADYPGATRQPHRAGHRPR